jgi:LysR family glycine cleavage system transcriptional activator
MSKTHKLGRLPPLNALRSFEAAARHASFTEAAAELGVTQGAVSRSIRTLEDHLGFALFERRATGLATTPAARIYATALGSAFARMRDATDTLTAAQARSVLTVRAYTSFIMWWLVPRLPGFRQEHPDIAVRLLSASDQMDLSRQGVDVRIRYGHGQWKGMNSILLFRDELSPICSPNLLDPAGAPYPPEILADHVLLHSGHRHDDWRDWMEAAGVAAPAPRGELTFDELSIVYECAASGLGLAVGQHAYFSQLLSGGRLFRPFAPVLHRSRGYHLVHAAERTDAAAIGKFRDWLLSVI